MMHWSDTENQVNTDELQEETGNTGEWPEDPNAEEIWCFENIRLNDRVFIRLAVLSGKGLFMILPYKGRDDAATGREARLIVGVDAYVSRILFDDGGGGYLLSTDGMSLLPVEDTETFFMEWLKSDRDHGARGLDSQSVARLRGRFGKYEAGEESDFHADERMSCNGLPYVLRHEPAKLGPIDLGISLRKRWYPVSEENTDHLVMKAALGGWFGLHRFSTDDAAAGLLYLLTCGCVGILPALDIVQYLLGAGMTNGRYEADDSEKPPGKTQMVLRKPVRKKLAILCIPVAIAVGLLAWRLIYQGLIPAVFQAVLSLAEEGGSLWQLEQGWK